MRTTQRRAKEWRGIMAKSWFTLALMKGQRHPVDCQKWRWLQRIPGAKVSVTSFGEATGRQD